MNINMKKSNELQKRAMQLLPLGVNSNFRFWGEGITPYVKKAKGAYLWDVDGNQFIDYRLAFGPIILGHAYDEVDRKVEEALREGVLFAMTSEAEIEVAEKMIGMCPGLDMIRLATTGTEATMHAVRVARAFTGREKLIKFEGMYHGFHDHLLFSTYSPVEAYGNIHNPIPVPASSGIPRCLGNLVTTLPFNHIEVLEKTFRHIGNETAALILEPCMGNCASIEPVGGFLEYVRQKCTEYGIVLILDEVKTGFRIANGGAQEYFKIKPDLATYAKSLGNGYPVAALGGKREIMSIIGKGVAQGGTYNNNRLGVVAANTVLDILKREPVIETINRRGARLMNGLQTIFEKAGYTFVMSGYPSMFSYSFGIKKVTNQREWAESDHEFYLELVEAAIERGVMPDHDPREPWFLSYSHSDADIERTLNVMEDAVKAVKK
jgi:glutamate-1-semialdehyde 2,1-aminomutase